MRFPGDVCWQLCGYPILSRHTPCSHHPSEERRPPWALWGSIGRNFKDAMEHGPLDNSPIYLKQWKMSHDIVHLVKKKLDLSTTDANYENDLGVYRLYLWKPTSPTLKAQGASWDHATSSRTCFHLPWWALVGSWLASHGLPAGTWWHHSWPSGMCTQYSPNIHQSVLGLPWTILDFPIWGNYRAIPQSEMLENVALRHDFRNPNHLWWEVTSSAT